MNKLLPLALFVGAVFAGDAPPSKLTTDQIRSLNDDSLQAQLGELQRVLAETQRQLKLVRYCNEFGILYKDCVVSNDFVVTKRPPETPTAPATK